jgi:hypothetical protein
MLAKSCSGLWIAKESRKFPSTNDKLRNERHINSVNRVDKVESEYGLRFCLFRKYLVMYESKSCVLLPICT